MHYGRDTDPAVERWAGAGHSDDSHSARAGAEAVAAAITGEDPRLVVVFASPRHDLEALANAACGAAGPAELIGCSGNRGVDAFALGGRGFSVASAAAPVTGGDPRNAGQSAALCLGALDDGLPHRALIVLADRLAGDSQDVVRGAYSVAAAGVSLVGGCTGGEESAQLHGGRVLRRSVVAAALASEAPLGVGVRHGWRPGGEPLLVTASENNTLHALNDRPALDVYLEVLEAPQEVRQDRDGFLRFADLHPFGVTGARRREPQIRAVVGADFESRSLQCSAEVPGGTLAWVMEGRRDQVLGATAMACWEALVPLGGQPPLGLLAFNSAARAAVLGGAGVREERARITAAASGGPDATLYSHGEIARTRGLAGFHSHTLAVLAIG